MITEVKSEKVEVELADQPSEILIGAGSFFGPVAKIELRTNSGSVASSSDIRLEPPPAAAGTLLSDMANQSYARARRFSDSAIAWIDAGASALAARDLDQAKRAFESALELDSDNRRAILGLSRTLKELGDIDRAVSLLRSFFQRHPSDLEVRVGLALALRAIGSADESLRLLLVDSVEDSEFAALLTARGAMYVERGEYRLAMSDLRKAVRLRPDSVYARNMLGVAEANVGNFLSAERRFREAVRTSPTYSESLLNLVKILEKDGRWRETLDLAERYWRPADAPFALALHIGAAALRGADARVARDWFEGAVANATDSAERATALNNLGVAFGRLGKHEDAERFFRASVHEHPSDISVSNVAKILLEQGDPGSAISWLLDVKRFHAPGKTTLHTFAVALLQGDRVPEAIDVAQTLVHDEDADKWSFALLAGLFAEGLSDYESSIQVARSGLERWPHDAMLQNNLCYALILARHLEEATSRLERLADETLEQRELTHVTATRGLLALYRGDLSEGWRLYEEAATIAGQASLRDRVKVKRDLEMGRALLRVHAPTSEVRAHFQRAAEGPQTARLYARQAREEMRRITGVSPSVERSGGSE